MIAPDPVGAPLPPDPSSFACSSSSTASCAPAALPTDAAPEAGWLYVGSVAGHPSSLWLPAEPQAVASGTAQTLRLAQAEPLIAAVEQWLCAAWDPAPARMPPSTATHHAVVRDPALAPPGTRLGLPVGALQSLPPETLRAPRLAWDCVTAEVLLDTATADALAALVPGDLLWLPASLGRWTVRLRDVAGHWPDCPAQLDLHAQRLSVAADAPAALPALAAANGDGEVLLCARVRVPLDHWLGFARAGLAFHWPMPQPWAAELRSAATAQVLASGALLPLGQGCGLRLDAPDNATAAAASPTAAAGKPDQADAQNAYVLS